MKRFFMRTLLLAITFISSACSFDDAPNFHYVTLAALSAELPEFFELNETYQIKVTFVRNGNCVFFEEFNVLAKDTTLREVVLFGTEFTDGPCTNDVVQIEESFNFIVLYDQPYIFRFYQGTNENGEHQYFEVTVPVI